MQKHGLDRPRGVYHALWYLTGARFSGGLASADEHLAVRGDDDRVTYSGPAGFAYCGVAGDTDMQEVRIDCSGLASLILWRYFRK